YSTRGALGARTAESARTNHSERADKAVRAPRRWAFMAPILMQSRKCPLPMDRRNVQRSTSNVEPSKLDVGGGAVDVGRGTLNVRPSGPVHGPNARNPVRRG